MERPVSIVRSFVLAMLAWACAAGMFPATSIAGQRVALVVGNSEYSNAPSLTNPRNDAALMRDTLEAAGFQVTALIDADHRSLKQALLAFGRALRGGDIEAGLFYYAGHGVQVAGENYLIPVNAAITSEDEIELEAINVNSFLRVMNSSDARVNIVILDACRDNPFKAASRSMSRGLAPVDAPKGTYIAYATAPGDVALDGNGTNSPYTLALTRAMGEPGMPIERVFKNARVSVLEETGEKQVPWEVSSITGEFYFSQAKAASADTGSNKVGGADHSGATGSGGVAEQAFRLAEEMNSADAWNAFIAQYGGGNAFYRSLAEQKLAALTPAPETRQSLPLPRHAGEICQDGVAGYSARTVCVSSVLDPQYGNRYGGSNLFDANPSTAWVEGVRGNGEGQSIVLQFDGPRRPRTIELVNGYAKNDDIFYKNSRVRLLEIKSSAGERFTLEIDDRQDWQTIALPVMKECAWLELTIRDVYAGSKYQDTAISELRVQ